MGVKTVSIITDDFDGSELPEDTAPVKMVLGRTLYTIYLSDDNHGKLLEVIQPFIENATQSPAQSQSAGSTPRRAASGGTDSETQERNRKVRHWAISTKFKFTDNNGNEKMVGERGRIPDAATEAWEKAGPPDIGE